LKRAAGEAEDLFEEISAATEGAARELLAKANLRPGQIFVLGCSTSEVQGKRIGKGTSMEVAAAILKPLLRIMRENNLYLAVQCCEHLNRALVVEAALAERYDDDVVKVYPVPGAGGAAAALAMELFAETGAAGKDTGLRRSGHRPDPDRYAFAAGGSAGTPVGRANRVCLPDGSPDKAETDRGQPGCILPAGEPATRAGKVDVKLLGREIVSGN
jgi:hypothetical protein